MTCREAFAVCVKRLIDQGIDRMKAVRQAKDNNPVLYDGMMKEAADASTRRDKASAKPAPTMQSSARREFKAQVEQLVSTGITRSRAVLDVAASNPSLHRRMLNDANGNDSAADVALGTGSQSRAVARPEAPKTLEKIQAFVAARTKRPGGGYVL